MLFTGLFPPFLNVSWSRWKLFDFFIHKKTRKLITGYTRYSLTGAVNRHSISKQKQTILKTYEGCFFLDEWWVFDFPYSCAFHRYTSVSNSFPPTCERFEFFLQCYGWNFFREAYCSFSMLLTLHTGEKEVKCLLTCFSLA